MGNHHVIDSQDLVVGLHHVPRDARGVHLDEKRRRWFEVRERQLGVGFLRQQSREKVRKFRG